MPKKKVNIVWLKRDLRLQDHAPLAAAEKAALPYCVLYLFEPDLIKHPDTSHRHLQFIYSSLRELDRQLEQWNGKVNILHANAHEAFDWLHQRYDVKQVFSHRESGIQLSWERDKEVKRLFNKNGIQWTEFRRDGILRGIEDRKGWDKQWYVHMHSPIIENSYHSNFIILDEHLFPLQEELLAIVNHYPKQYQPAGEKNAWKYLESFANERGKDYFKYISKPALSRKHCSRISPYLSWGNLSIRQAFQYVSKHPNRSTYKRAFTQFLSRLKWHCHFIQKFEVECSYEKECLNKGYELMPYENDPNKLRAWMDGNTGLPMVDACMRAVKATGWINFRMRAMVVSFLCHHLDVDWRKGVYFLAQQFLDYEPGIHYPQFQMQAGTTGINTVRIYNPVKQSMDHDKEGIFIKKWVPELQKVPVDLLHEPWKTTELEKELYEIPDHYRKPIIDLEESGKYARKKIWGHRNHPAVKQEKNKILQRHTRNTPLRRKEAE